MAAPSVYRRNFENFKGLNQAATDLTRPFEYADVASNITHTRSNVIAKRHGSQPQSRRDSQLGYGLHSYEYALDTRTFFTGYNLPASATTLSYTPPSGTVDDWAFPSRITADDGSNAQVDHASDAYSDWLIGYDYGFDIPHNAYIVGVSVVTGIFQSPGGGPNTAARFAFTTDSGASIATSERPSDTFDSGTEIELSVGGEDIIWGEDIMTPNNINASTFGVCLRTSRSVLGVTANVDYIKVGFYYKPLVPETQEELLAMGSNLHRKKTGTIVVTNTTGNSGSFGVVPTASGYQVTLEEQGLPVAGWPKTYSTGVSPDLISDLYTDVNAESGWAMAVTPIARVNGAVIDDTSVTVDSSPQTFADGQMVGLPDSSTGETYWRFIHEVSGTPSLELDNLISVDDNEWLGLGREPVSNIPVTEETNISNGGTLTIEVPYFEGVPNIATAKTFADIQSFFGGPSGTKDRPFFDTSFFGNVGQRNFSFVNARNVSYFGVPFYINSGIPTITINGVTQKANTGLWKYDGLCTYTAGLPLPPDDFFPNATVAGGSLQNATYKYAFQLSGTDFRGNIVDGPILDEDSSASDMEVAIGGTASYQEFDWDHGLSAGTWNCRYATIGSSTTQTGVNTITVDAGHSLIPGCKVLLWDEDNSEYTERLVTATTRTSITVDGDPLGVDGTAYRTLSDRFYISTMKLVIWRTKGDGTIYYFAGERPVAAGTIRFIEGVADANLGSQLIFPDRTPDLFPKLSFLTTHQGLIVGSGNPDDPEAVYFADALNFESSPSSTSSFKVIGGGKVTALASDSDDMLAVFKDRHYFNVVGDLDSLSFQVLEVSKGEFGCPAHHALVKVKNSLIFPSETGFRAISSGQLVSNFLDRLTEDFSYNFYEQVPGTAIDSVDEDKLVIKRSVAAYDETTGEYICFVPCESGTPNASGSLVPNSNSTCFVYNAEKDSWYKWNLPVASNLAGGIVMFQRGLWWQTRADSSGVYGQVQYQKRAQNQYDFSDDVTAITTTLRMTWDSLDNPSSWFRALFLKLMQFHPVEYVTSFGWTVNEYRNFDESTKYTQATRTFSSSSEREKRVKFKSGKASSVSLEFTNIALFEKSLLSGYEYTVAPPYRQAVRWGRGD